MARAGPTWRGSSPVAGTATWGAGPGRPFAWPGRSPPGRHSEPQEYCCDVRGPGVGQCHRTNDVTEPREPEARPTHQAPAATAEAGEGRESAKGNAGQHTRVRPQCRVALSRALAR